MSRATTIAPAPLRAAEIRPPDLMAAKADCVEQDRRYLLDRRSEWVPRRCPACDASAGTRYGVKQGFIYEQCTACDTVYTNPAPSPDLLRRFYRDSRNYAFWNTHVFPATEAVRRERIFAPRAARLAQHASALNQPIDTMIDVGAAFGTFCVEALRCGLTRRAIALEPTPDLAATCRSRGLPVIESPLESCDTALAADMVTAFEVIEHTFAPAEFIDAAARLLRPGGLLVLSCPNVRGFGIARLGVASGSFDHEHLNYFHPASLANLVASRGLDVIETLTPGELDADLVRQAAGRGEVDLTADPLLSEILLRDPDRLAGPFQRFLADHGLSSHLWLIARRPR